MFDGGNKREKIGNMLFSSKCGLISRGKSCKERNKRGGVGGRAWCWEALVFCLEREALEVLKKRFGEGSAVLLVSRVDTRFAQRKTGRGGAF